MSQEGSTFRVGGWAVDPEANRLTDGTHEVRVGATAMAVLVHLVAKAGKVATKDELVETVWQGKAVSDDALAVCIYELRKALGDQARAPTYIETITGKGYRWLPAVTELHTPRSDAPEPETSTDPAVGAATDGASPVRRRPRRWRAAVTALVTATLLAAWWGRTRSADPEPEPASPPTVAVLPLADDSPEPAPTRVLADGVTDALIQGLARRGAVQVVSRTSIARFVPPSHRSATEIADELGADALIEGSVRRIDNELKVALRLIDGATDRHLWAATYDLPFGDLPALAQNVAAAIDTALLDGEPSADEPVALAALEPAALDAYLEGRFAYFQAVDGTGTFDDLLRARDLFEQALELEPDFVDGLLGAALTDLMLRWVGFIEPGLDQRVQAAIDRAHQIDPDAASVHWVQAEDHIVFDRDLDAAEARLRRALDLSASSGEIYLAYAWVLRMRTDYEAAEAMAQRALRLDPLAAGPLWLLADVAFEHGRHVEALTRIDRLERLVGARRWPLRADVLLELGRRTEALAALAQVGDGIEDPDARQAITAAVARDDLEAVLAVLAERLPVGATIRAGHLTRLGRFDEALDALEAAYATGDPGLMLLRTLPALRPLHGEARFRVLLRDLGLAARETG